MICHFREYRECACEDQCIQIIVDRAPLIRPERQDIKTVIAFGVLVAMLVYFFGPMLDEHFRIEAQDRQEASVQWTK